MPLSPTLFRYIRSKNFHDIDFNLFLLVKPDICVKGQIKSEWIYEIIDFRKMTPKFEGILPWEFL